MTGLINAWTCKDCGWYVIRELTKYGEPDKRYKPSFCELWEVEMAENDYCSKAIKQSGRLEKKDDHR